MVTSCALVLNMTQDASLNNAEATALTLTACGNFVLIGYSTGHVDRFKIPYFTFSLMLAL